MTAPVVIDLLRHGDTGRGGFRGRTDDPLTPAGWRQMQQVTGAQSGWQAVVTSPLARCAVFAGDFADRNGLPLEQDARLAELDFGNWEGADAAQLMQTDAEALRRFWEDPWTFTPPNGETLEAFERRICDAWSDLSERYRHRPVLVVTHGGVIRMLLRLARGLPRSELLRLEVPHASLHRIGAPIEEAA